MKKIEFNLFVSILLLIFFSCCSSKKLVLVLKNETDISLKRLNIIEKESNHQLHFQSINFIPPLSTDIESPVKIAAKRNSTINIVSELENGRVSALVSNNKIYKSFPIKVLNDTNITLSIKNKNDIITSRSNTNLIIQNYNDNARIIAGKSSIFILKSTDTSKIRFEKDQNYKLRLEDETLYPDYLKILSKDSLQITTLIPLRPNIVGSKRLYLLDQSGYLVDFVDIVIARDEEPKFQVQCTVPDDFYEGNEFKWIIIHGKNLYNIISQPRIFHKDIEIEDYNISSDTTLSLKIRGKNYRRINKVIINIDYLSSTKFNEAERKTKSYPVELCTDSNQTQYLLIQGSVAAGSVGQDSTFSKTSAYANGGMVWNYKLNDGKELRAGIFYSYSLTPSKSDTIYGTVASVYGGSIYNPYLRNGAEAKIELLNFYNLLGFIGFPERRFGIYVGGSVNRLIWKTYNVNSEPKRIFSMVDYAQTLEGQVEINRAGVSFNAIDQIEKESLNKFQNIAGLKFEGGLITYFLGGDLGLSENKKSLNSILGKPNRLNYFGRYWGFELRSHIRFNQIFADVQINWFSKWILPKFGSIPGFTGSRFAINVGLTGNFIRFDLN